MDFKIEPMVDEDYAQVLNIDILTMKQYLGTKWESLSHEEQQKLLVARKPYFDGLVKQGFSFVSRSRETIVAFVLARIPAPYNNELFIEYIAIHPDHQGKGIGPKLYEAVIHKAQISHIYKIKALINTNNLNSMKLHENVGFTLQDKKEAVMLLQKN